MAAGLKGISSLSGLQHAEQNTIIGFFNSFASGFKAGTITLIKFGKTTAVVAGLTVPAVSVAYKISGAGFGAVRGKDVFVVPGPEVGSGISFAIAAALFGIFAFYRTRRSSAV